MRALVTGANGFLGNHVVRALRDIGMGVRVLNRVPAENRPDVEQFTANLATSDSLAAAFDGVDVLVHLAAAMRGRMDEMMRNTVDGTRRLLVAMTRSATRRVVAGAGSSVYRGRIPWA